MTTFSLRGGKNGSGEEGEWDGRGVDRGKRGGKRGGQREERKMSLFTKLNYSRIS